MNRLFLASMMLLASCAAPPAVITVAATAAPRAVAASASAAPPAKVETATAARPTRPRLRAANPDFPRDAFPLPGLLCEEADYRTGCEDASNGKGCFDWGICLAAHDARDKRLAAIWARAIPLLEEECNRRDPVSCSDLGALLAEGRGAPVDIARAAPLLVKGCDGRDGYGCRRLGALVRDGKVKGGTRRALEVFERGCLYSDEGSCAALADLPGRTPAEIWNDLTRACGAGNDEACYRLAHDDSLVPQP